MTSTQSSPAKPTSQPTTIRQGSNIAFGVLGMLLGLALMIGGAASVSRDTLVPLGILLAAFSYLVMFRPFLAVTSEGLTVSNVIRESLLPWDGIHHATSRGSLVIHDNDGHKTTVWAISSQRAVVDRSNSASGQDPRGRVRPQSADDLVAGHKSALALKEAINAETVDNPTDTPAGRVTRWLPIPCVVAAVAVAAFLYLFIA